MHCNASRLENFPGLVAAEYSMPSFRQRRKELRGMPRGYSLLPRGRDVVKSAISVRCQATGRMQMEKIESSRLICMPVTFGEEKPGGTWPRVLLVPTSGSQAAFCQLIAIEWIISSTKGTA